MAFCNSFVVVEMPLNANLCIGVDDEDAEDVDFSFAFYMRYLGVEGSLGQRLSLRL